MTAAWYRWDGEDLVVRVRLQPRASRDEVVGVREGALVVRLTAPPVEGKANAALCALLAKRLGVPKSRVHLEAGEKGRDKRLRIQRPRRDPRSLLP